MRVGMQIRNQHRGCLMWAGHITCVMSRLMTQRNDSKSCMMRQNHLGRLISGHLPRSSDLLRELFWQDQMVNLMLGQVQRPQTYEALSCLHTVDSEIAYNSKSLDLRTSSLGFLFFFSLNLFAAFRVKEIQANILLYQRNRVCLGWLLAFMPYGQVRRTQVDVLRDWMLNICVPSKWALSVTKIIF